TARHSYMFIFTYPQDLVVGF
ncbi:hypothetical protein BMETH_1426666729280, partial [methanotrophic bacterial endosymbiont of Bathymodiolus sp.]